MGMATAYGVIVPQQYWDTVREEPFDNFDWTWTHYIKDDLGKLIDLKCYPVTHPEGQRIEHIKSYKLA